MFIRCVFIITVKNYPRVIPKDTSHTIQKNLCQHVFLETGLTNVKCCVATKDVKNSILHISLAVNFFASYLYQEMQLSGNYFMSNSIISC